MSVWFYSNIVGNPISGNSVPESTSKNVNHIGRLVIKTTQTCILPIRFHKACSPSSAVTFNVDSIDWRSARTFFMERSFGDRSGVQKETYKCQKGALKTFGHKCAYHSSSASHDGSFDLSHQLVNKILRTKDLACLSKTTHS